jgi:subtilisin family serine protease
MARVKGKEQLCRTENYKDNFKSFQGLGSFTLFERYDALENIVDRRIDGKYSHFLAQPVVDEDSITWFSKPYSETPRQLSVLQGEERARYEKIVTDTIGHYKSVISSLKQEGKASEAEGLENAIKYINEDFVYCFDDKTVLGVWGMQLRNEVRESLGVVMKPLFVKKSAIEPLSEPQQQSALETVTEPATEPEALPQTNPTLPDFAVRFNPGENGILDGPSELTKQTSAFISEGEIPKIKAKEGYEFAGWDKSPNNHFVDKDIEFTAQYRQIPAVVVPPKIPWYLRFWRWLVALLTGEGCLKWLWWLLLLLLLLFLLFWLFRSCHMDHVAQIPYPVRDKPFIHDDPRARGGGIYHPGDPYNPVPTPPGYRDVLPPDEGVLPPLDSSKIIRDPGKPVIVGNRLNIIMEDEDKSIKDLAKDFKAKYPDDKYKVVYYDDVVKRMQIEVPEEDREQLKKDIPEKFAPNYKLFVFDEALFDERYTPNDPAFNDPNKSWYLKTIRAPQAWDITKGSTKLTIAIVDNGFNLNHPELASKVVMPYNVWSHSKNIFAQKVDHGTHVAGTALAIMDNGQGICGIAPTCAFMPVQVGNADGVMTTTSVLDGILYALYQGADVINVSLGGKYSDLTHFSIDYQQDLVQHHFKEEEGLWQEIMKIADKHKATIVVAAGNDNILAGIDPLQRPKDIVTVAAINKNNQPFSKADFSNYGSYTTISAPGVDIYSCVGTNNYATMSGTSMAAPIVTGGIALLKSLNDSLTNKQIICILQSSGLQTDGDVGKLIQLDKALEKVRSGNVSDCAIPSTGDVQILLNWKNYNDLDLICTDPMGNTVWFKNKAVTSGGQLQIDMNAAAPFSKTPIENIYWPTGGAPKGTYNVYLLYYKIHEPAIDETPYTIFAKHGGKTDTIKGVIRKADSTIHICTFTLGVDNNRPTPQNPDTSTHNTKSNLLQERERLRQELERIDRELRKIDSTRVISKIN